MEELLDEVERIMKNELARANKKNPLFNSPHEAYAVIKEGAEEADMELQLTNYALGCFWNEVKEDSVSMYRFLLDVRKNAMNLAAEAIQVAAMAQKAIDSIEVKQK